MAATETLAVLAAMAGESAAPQADNVAVRQLLRRVPAPLGTADALEEALLSQWLSRCGAATGGLAAVGPDLEAALERSSFLLGHGVRGADVFVYLQIWAAGLAGDPAGLEARPSVARWARTLQQLLPELLGADAAALLPAGPSGPGAALAEDATLMGLLAALPRQTGPHASFAAALATPAPTETAVGGGGKAKAKAAASENGSRGAEETKGGGAPAGEGKKSKKKEKRAKKGGAAEATAGDKAASDELLPTVLEIRVGVMLKVWAHEDADKLYCEEIDLGEEGGGVRNIASGLREFYATAEELTGRRVLVVCNLKAKNARGFPSNGMVLCASNADHSVVKLLEPPESAALGERVLIDGLEPQEPMKPNAMAKKKVLEKLGPEMMTDADGVANFRGHVFTVGGAVCRADVPNGLVA